MRFLGYIVPLLATTAFQAVPAYAQATSDAEIFGQRNSITGASLSPDGSKILFISAGEGRSSVAMVAPVSGGKPTTVSYTNGEPWQMRWCDWSDNKRIVCMVYGVLKDNGPIAPYTRLLSMNIDGTNVVELGQQNQRNLRTSRQFDGNIIGWDAGPNGQILMARQYTPEADGVSRVADRRSGLAVEIVDPNTGKSKNIEAADDKVIQYFADKQGNVRMKAEQTRDYKGQLNDDISFFYRIKGKRDWLPFTAQVNGKDANPAEISSTDDSVYAYVSVNGKDALYSISLDGQFTAKQLVANSLVDLDNLVTIGRDGRVIGVDYVTDRRRTKFFIPEYEELNKQLQFSFDGFPNVSFRGEADNGNKLLIQTSSDTNPGKYFLLDRASNKLDQIFSVRPELDNRALAKVKAVSYLAGDGTKIPAYLTMPAVAPIGAIVMPHGGPSSRDELEFDWLAQFYAARGYAVLQPNYRGSSGFGDEWYVNNGFKSWNIATGDINAGGRWLIEQKIVTADKLAIVGWSYGGYAALQGHAIEPSLYKAVVAIAPVVDLQMLVDDAKRFTNSKLTRDFVGQGPHIIEGSPLRRASAFTSPVLLFSGDLDLNVDVRHAKEMNSALKKAGKSSELVIFEGLDHQLPDSKARAEMLNKSDLFLRSSLGIK
jgi:dipeptidyl aminopeptidase/acylaminoacyl peptidase